jgi:hypothetical protein
MTERLSTTRRAPCAGPAPTFSTVEVAHTRLIERLAVSTPHRILYIADARDLGERAEHLQQVLGAVLDYVGAIVVDTSHVAGGGSTRPSSCCRGRSRSRQRPNDLLPRLLLGPIAEPDARSASILIDELDAGFFQNSLDVRERFWVARVTSDFEVGDRIAMQAGRISKVSHRPIQCGPSHSHLCTCHSHLVVLLSHVATAHAYHEGVKLSCLRR